MLYDLLRVFLVRCFDILLNFLNDTCPVHAIVFADNYSLNCLERKTDHRGTMANNPKTMTGTESHPFRASLYVWLVHSLLGTFSAGTSGVRSYEDIRHHEERRSRTCRTRSISSKSRVQSSRGVIFQHIPEVLLECYGNDDEPQKTREKNAEAKYMTEGVIAIGVKFDDGSASCLELLFYLDPPYRQTSDKNTHSSWSVNSRVCATINIAAAISPPPQRTISCFSERLLGRRRSLYIYKDIFRIICPIKNINVRDECFRRKEETQSHHQNRQKTRHER